MRCSVKSGNERNPHLQLLTGYAEDFGETAVGKAEEGEDDVKSSWPLWAGLHTCYNGNYNRSRKGNFELIFKNYLSSDCRLQLACMKPELLVTAGQPYCGEYVPGSCTHRPSHHGSWFYLKPIFNRPR